MNNRLVKTVPLDRIDSRHVRGFVVLAVGQILARGMTFVATSYLARVLGVEMFGLVGFAAAVVAYFLMVVDAGLDYVAMREIARQNASGESVVTSVLTLRLGLAAVAMALLCAVAPWLGSSSTAIVVILAYGLTLFSFASNLKCGLQALEQNGVIAIGLALSQAVYLGSVLLFVEGPYDALKVPFLLFAAELISAGFLLICYRRLSFRLFMPPSRGLSWALLKEAFPLAGTHLVRSLSMNFDLLLLALIDSLLAVGMYTAISRIILLLREFGALYYLPLFPGLSRAAKEATDRFVLLGEAGLRHAAALIFPLAAGGCLAAPELLFFVFGPDYVPGAHAFCLLLAAVALAMLAGIYRFGLIVHNRQKTLFCVTALASTLNIGMNFILIPRYSVIGGALSAVVSEFFLFIVAWLALRRLVALSPWKPITRPALATGGMVAILWLMPTGSLFVTVSIGAISYAMLIFLVGAIRLSEVVDAWRARSPVVVEELRE